MREVRYTEKNNYPQNTFIKVLPIKSLYNIFSKFGLIPLREEVIYHVLNTLIDLF